MMMSAPILLSRAHHSSRRPLWHLITSEFAQLKNTYNVWASAYNKVSFDQLKLYKTARISLINGFNKKCTF